MARCAVRALWFIGMQPALARAVVHELSLYPASSWFSPLHSSIVNATASYLDDLGRFCTSTDARVAGHIVVTPFSAMQDAPSGSQALTCTAEQLYLNMQASGAAAWVTFCDHYNISAGAFFRLRGNYPPHSAQYSMAFFDAGTQIDQELLQSIRSGKDRM